MFDLIQNIYNFSEYKIDVAYGQLESEPTAKVAAKFFLQALFISQATPFVSAYYLVKAEKGVLYHSMAFLQVAYGLFRILFIPITIFFLAFDIVRSVTGLNKFLLNQGILMPHAPLIQYGERLNKDPFSFVN